VSADPLPLFALAGLILVKEAGIPVPVPGDLIVLGAGVAASRGDLDPVLALVLLVIASLIGGAVQFTLLRSVARPALMALLSRFAPVDRIDRQTERFKRRGARSVALARMTPGVRIVAIAASALAGIPAAAFVGGLAVGNGVFIAAHFGLGYVVGEPIVSVLGRALGPIAIVATGLAAAGLAGWILVSRRRRATAGTGSVAAVGAWADACCPACLSVAVLRAGR
jgi:membrane protein DedA with SNARE-associated domain